MIDLNGNIHSPCSCSRLDNLREAHAAACKERDELKRELQTYKTVFNEDALLNLTARYLGTAPDRLRELTAADKDGRLMVLPCRIGRTVYRRSYYHDCADNLYETCQLFAYDESACFRCYKDKLVPYVKETGFELSMLEDFGDTVFLTREEAEAVTADGYVQME